MFVDLFGRRQMVRVEGARMNLGVPGRTLGQNGPYSHVGGVHLHNELGFRVWMDQDGSSCESSLEFLE